MFFWGFLKQIIAEGKQFATFWLFTVVDSLRKDFALDAFWIPSLVQRSLAMCFLLHLIAGPAPCFYTLGRGSPLHLSAGNETRLQMGGPWASLDRKSIHLYHSLGFGYGLVMFGLKFLQLTGCVCVCRAAMSL